jgi:NAD(P)-dependent dehydrogenase (short-subunit alcohol dehydrogenase family)
VLITGGSQGLGEAMAIDFAKKGANLVLVSRSEEKLKLALNKVEVRILIKNCKFVFWLMVRLSEFPLSRGLHMFRRI